MFGTNNATCPETESHVNTTPPCYPAVLRKQEVRHKRNMRYLLQWTGICFPTARLDVDMNCGHSAKSVTTRTTPTDDLVPVAGGPS